MRLSAATSTTLGKVLLSVATLGAAGSIAGLGTFATFTDTASQTSGNISTGTVIVDVGATGGGTNRLDIGASNVAPGDTIQRALNLVNTSSLDLASITLTTAASTSSKLDDGTATGGTANGLQVQVDRCSVPWTETVLAGPAYTYTCSGTSTPVLATRAVIMSTQALTNLTTAAGGGTDYLRVVLSLPSTAGNDLQGLTSQIGFTFTATQRAATNK